MSLRIRRLLPEPGELTPPEAVAGLAGRDVLVLNMVTSADGRAALDGHTAQLSDEADRQVFHALRAQADAILVGTGTLRAERYGRFTKDAERRALREAAGLDPEPLGVIVTRTLDVPWDIPLFADPAARVLVLSGAEGEAPELAARVQVVHTTELAPRAVLDRLRAEYGVHCVLCEGGPTLNGALFSDDVVDELFLSVAPALAGGSHPLTMLEGQPAPPRGLELLQALEHEGTLLLRYRVRPAG